MEQRNAKSGTKSTREMQSHEISPESFAKYTNYTHCGFKYDSRTLNLMNVLCSLVSPVHIKLRTIFYSLLHTFHASGLETT